MPMMRWNTFGAAESGVESTSVPGLLQPIVMKATDAGQVVSNGGSQALTASDWQSQAANQAIINTTVDNSRVSPLENAYLTASVPSIPSKPVALEAPSNFWLYTLGGLFVLSLLRRK